MKIDFELLDKMLVAGASGQMIVDLLREKYGSVGGPKTKEAFLQFKAAYPRRDGSNPWQPALKKFETLVKSGVDPELIIAAAVKFSQEEAARGNIGSRFIPQAVTWLNQHRFADIAQQNNPPAEV